MTLFKHNAFNQEATMFINITFFFKSQVMSKKRRKKESENDTYEK